MRDDTQWLLDNRYFGLSTHSTLVSTETITLD